MDSRLESISQTIPSLNVRSVVTFNEAFTSSERISFGRSSQSSISGKKSGKKNATEGGKKVEQNELKMKGKLIMEPSLSALTLAAIIGASARTVDLRPRKIELSS